MQTSADNDFFKKKHTSSVAYLVAILLFLLPFVQIKCNDMAIAENTGVGLAFGADYKTSGQMKSMQNGFNSINNAETKQSKETGKMYIAALAALLLGVIGLLLSLNGRSASFNTIIGVIAAIALIAVMIQVKGDVKDHMAKENTSDNFGGAVKTSVDFTLWYYLSVISFLAAAFFNYKKGQVSVVNTLPPQNAPQVPIENPGEQSEFPTSASESEVG